jgi:hypothetical protein
MSNKENEDYVKMRKKRFFDPVYGNKYEDFAKDAKKV